MPEHFVVVDQDRSSTFDNWTSASVESSRSIYLMLFVDGGESLSLQSVNRFDKFRSKKRSQGSGDLVRLFLG